MGLLLCILCDKILLPALSEAFAQEVNTWKAMTALDFFHQDCGKVTPFYSALGRDKNASQIGSCWLALSLSGDINCCVFNMPFVVWIDWMANRG